MLPRCPPGPEPSAWHRNRRCDRASPGSRLEGSRRALASGARTRCISRALCSTLDLSSRTRAGRAWPSLALSEATQKGTRGRRPRWRGVSCRCRRVRGKDLGPDPSDSEPPLTGAPTVSSLSIVHLSCTVAYAESGSSRRGQPDRPFSYCSSLIVVVAPSHAARLQALNAISRPTAFRNVISVGAHGIPP